MGELQHKVGGGVHARGKEEYFDIIVTQISGSLRYRKGRVEIRGLDGWDCLKVSVADPDTTLVPGFKVGVSKRKSGTDMIRLFYRYDREYTITEIKS